MGYGVRRSEYNRRSRVVGKGYERHIDGSTIVDTIESHYLVCIGGAGLQVRQCVGGMVVRAVTVGAIIGEIAFT